MPSRSTVSTPAGRTVRVPARYTASDTSSPGRTTGPRRAPEASYTASRLGEQADQEVTLLGRFENKFAAGPSDHP
jgi:hypothetical protein